MRFFAVLGPRAYFEVTSKPDVYQTEDIAFETIHPKSIPGPLHQILRLHHHGLGYSTGNASLFIPSGWDDSLTVRLRVAPSDEGDRYGTIFPIWASAVAPEALPYCDTGVVAEEGDLSVAGQGPLTAVDHTVAQPVPWEEFQAVKQSLQAAKAQIRELELQRDCALKEAQQHRTELTFARTSGRDNKSDQREIPSNSPRETIEDLLIERDALVKERDEWRRQAQSSFMEPSLLEACRALEAVATAASLRVKRGGDL